MAALVVGKEETFKVKRYPSDKTGETRYYIEGTYNDVPFEAEQKAKNIGWLYWYFHNDVPNNLKSSIRRALNRKYNIA